MKVVLINPPSPYLDNDAAYPPVGLLHVAGSIEKFCGDKVEIVDLTAQSTTSIPAGADLYGITCVTPNFNTVKRIADSLPLNVPIIVGGPHPTAMPDHTLENMRCDTIVIGEAESIIVDLMNDANSGALKQRYEPMVFPPSMIQHQAFHLLDMDKYEKVSIHATRGCPFNCAFCSKISRRAYSKRPIEDVINEVLKLVLHGRTHIVFGDDDISIDDIYIMSLLEALRPLLITFRLNMSVRKPIPVLYRAAAAAGCTEVSFGVESGSQKMLDAMNKQALVEDSEWSIRLARECGVASIAYLMVNFPGETERTVQETIDFIERTKPDRCLVSSFAPLPGSDVFNNPGKYGITWMSDDWDSYYLVGKGGSFTPCYETEKLTVERQIYLHDMLLGGLRDATT